MKKYIILLFSIIFLVSCNTKVVEVVEEYYPDSTPKLVRYYKDDGKSRELIKEAKYYPNHNKFYEGEYENNKKHGKWFAWYENGNIWSEGSFNEGKDEGQRTVYYENGSKHYQGEYSDGKMVGVWKFWDEQGKLVEKKEYN